ncbi:MAG TPA: NAD(P)H-dependent oxidoreductase, partial [Myxococcaceae bacterium]|nr:NAD(P)H-dependent oxidoreductase [Myxococcaceae bacterium]
MSKHKLVAICGSLRSGSFNAKLLKLAVGEAERLGAEVDTVDLKALAIPVYDGDIEHESGPPPSVVELKDRIRAAAGLLIASPEYNHSIPGGLKNAIDWASRAPSPPFRNKVAALMGS